jgi:hypothetical protein
MAADNSGMIKLGVVAAVAYYAYSQGWLSSLGIGPAVAPVVPVPVVANPNVILGANSLGGIFQRMVAAAQAPSAGLGVDAWGSYLNTQLAPLGKAAPDPMPIFQAAVPNFDRGQLLNAAQYWAVMAPALGTQLGLSGLGFCRGMVA